MQTTIRKAIEIITPRVEDGIPIFINYKEVENPIEILDQYLDLDKEVYLYDDYSEVQILIK